MIGNSNDYSRDSPKSKPSSPTNNEPSGTALGNPFTNAVKNTKVVSAKEEPLPEPKPFKIKTYNKIALEEETKSTPLKQVTTTTPQNNLSNGRITKSRPALQEIKESSEHAKGSAANRSVRSYSNVTSLVIPGRGYKKRNQNSAHNSSYRKIILSKQQLYNKTRPKSFPQAK